MNRDTIIIGLACLIAIGVGSWLFFSDSAADTSDSTGTPVSLTVLAEGEHAGYLTERKNYRINSAEELTELWNMLGTESPAPAINFETSEVLAVFSGVQASGGYDVTITSVLDKAASRIVMIQYVAPESGCITTQAQTSPFQMVVVPKSDASIERHETTDTVECR